jgi:hypothetical protein
MQAAAQSSWLAAQLSAHWPLEHTLPGAHALSQLPQCSGSLLRSVQPLPQLSKGSRQLVVQTPFAQAASPPTGSGQTRPQAPQWLRSVARSTQPVPHGTCGLLQAKLQSPARQMPTPSTGALQVAPQPPQLRGSFETSTHAPAHGIEPAAQFMPSWQAASPSAHGTGSAPAR